MAHHHHLGLAYADYFAAGCADDGATVVVPDVGADHHHIYGVHQPGAEAFVPAEMAAAKSELGSHHHQQFLDFGGHRHQLGHQATTTLTSLSLHGQAAEAASLVRHQLGDLAFRQLQGSAWPQQQHQQQGGAWHLVRGSRFLLPTQQLLLEFCSLPVEITTAASKKPPANDPVSDDGNGGSSSSIAPLSARIQAMDAAELQRLKARLYTMLDEVDRRYRRYREQMKAVAGSFEAVAGARAAAAYTRLASRTISSHFRTLRDGVAAQVEAVRRALGEKDAAGAPRAAGAAIMGETTPRLRMLDQCLRQNRAYQAGMLESQPWRPQRGLPERAVSILRAWLFEHFLHPYPSDVDKHILARQTGLSRSQVSNWFINARVRLWKPMVEEMYSEEMKDDDREGECSNANFGKDPNPSSYTSEVQGRGGRAKQGNENDGGNNERKPTRAQLVVHDAGSLASVVSIGSSSSSRDQQQNLNFGVMDHLGFGAYDGHHAAADGQQGFGGGGGVSLTLGLHQQHADPHGGVNVAFAGAPSAAHEFLFMAGGGEQQMDVAGGGVYSGGHHFGAGVEGDTGVATLKTNYHLLHDLAG